MRPGHQSFLRTYAKCKVLIVGGTGFLGAPISKFLESSGKYDVSVTSQNLPRNLSIHGHAKYLDVSKSLSISDALSASKPEILINLAWFTKHGLFWEDPMNSSYHLWTSNLYEFAFRLGVKRILSIGTVSEYGLSPGACNAELTPVKPESEYGRMKVANGQMLSRLADEYGARFSWLRVFQAYGPGEHHRRLIPSTISGLREGRQLRVLRPNDLLDWIYNEDIASAISLILEREIDGVIDIGTSKPRYVHEIVNLIARELSVDRSIIDFDWSESGRQAYVAREAKLFREGWKPGIDVEQEIKRMCSK